jgi:hypothetical protein
VLFGQVQVGKTSLILAMIWICTYVLNKRCVLLLANMTGSYNQVLGKNAMEFNDMLWEEFGEAARPFFLRAHGGRDRGAKEIDPHCFLVAMSNPAQLRRLLDVTLKEETQEVVLFADEADVHVKSMDDNEDTTKTGPLYRSLEAQCIGTVNVSATPFALWNRRGALLKTIRMHTPPEYRGVEEMEWKHISGQDASMMRRGSIGVATRLLTEAIHTLKPRVEAVGRKYMTILVNGPSSIARQNALAMAISRTCRAFVMNSENGCPIKEAKRTRMVSTDRQSISTLYDEFETESKRSEAFHVYVIVACLTASRAISFRPTSKKIGTGGLNGMIFAPSPSSHMAQTIQFMRPFGKYSADYPQILVMTTKETEDKLRAEIHTNLPTLAYATRQMGESRKQMEGSPLLAVGRHDRRSVDDSRLEGRSSLMHREFESKEAVMAFLSKDYETMEEMTEGHIDIPMPGMVYYSGVADKKEQNRVRRELKAKLPIAYQKETLQFCWNDQRYETHHSIKSKTGDNHEYRSRCIAGDGGHDATAEVVRVVFWKPEHCGQQPTSLENENTAYIFETKRGGWRYYNSKEKRRYGVLSHEQ